MKMNKEDADLFYSIWLPLLEYVNKKYKVIKRLKNIPSAISLDISEVAEIAGVLYDHINVIDEYIEKTPTLTNEVVDILRSWKNFKRQRFIIERHLKKGSIFISSEDSKVYLVTGIISSVEEMYEGFHLPVFSQATLLPFKGKIITDGLVMTSQIYIGGNMAKSFKEIYMNAKKAGQIISELDTNSADENTPIVEREEVLELAFKFRDTHIWEKFWDNQIFALKLDNGEIAYICIMGKNGSHCALGVYIGDEGFNSYRALQNMDETFDIDFEKHEALLVQKAIHLAFEEKDMLFPEDYEEVIAFAKAHKIKLAGKNKYPSLIKYEPNHFPWKVTNEQDLYNIKQGLLAAIYMDEYLGNKEPEDIGIFEVGNATKDVPLFKISDNTLIREGFVKIPMDYNKKYDDVIYNNKSNITKLKRIPPKDVYEAQLIRMIKPVQEHPFSAPYYPLFLMIVEYNNDYVLPVPMVSGEDEDPERILDEFVNACIGIGYKPREIRCADQRTYALLKDICEKIGTRVKLFNGNMAALSKAKSGLFDHLTGHDAVDYDDYNEIMQMAEEILAMNRSEIRSMPKDLRFMIKSLIENDTYPPEIAAALRKKLKL